MQAPEETGEPAGSASPPRRDVLALAAGAVAAAGGLGLAWPFLRSLAPAADVLADAVLEVDLNPIPEGGAITVLWQGKPVFVRRRTAAEIAQARADDAAPMPDPAPDSSRVQRPEWLVVVGICTHLGCVPLGQRQGESRGRFDGWFCPCHGSHYDLAGRIRLGPAPRNLEVPPHAFDGTDRIRIG
jgi:ubiquinol-cytochrome c reductase iron-sulfur subunit